MRTTAADDAATLATDAPLSTPVTGSVYSVTPTPPPLPPLPPPPPHSILPLNPPPTLPPPPDGPPTPDSSIYRSPAHPLFPPHHRPPPLTSFPARPYDARSLHLPYPFTVPYPLPSPSLSSTPLYSRYIPSPQHPSLSHLPYPPSLSTSSSPHRLMNPQWHQRDSPMHWVAADASTSRAPPPPPPSHPLASTTATTTTASRHLAPRSLAPPLAPQSLNRPSHTHVEFHHHLDMDDTFVDPHEMSTARTASASRASTGTPSPSASATATAYPSSLPSTLQWPLHPHPLVYAGTSSGNSVHICTCRNCRSEHYNTAVYSCIERGCNFHICIQCALEQITAMREQERMNEAIRRGGLNNGVGGGGKNGGTHGMDGKYDEDDEAVDIDMTHRVPIKGGRRGKVSQAVRRWTNGVLASSSSLGIPLVLVTAHHAHPLLYTPLTPFHLHEAVEDKLHTHTPLLSSISADRWNCSSTSSHHCIAYQSPGLHTSIPTYSCSHCAYRLCFPCLRHLYIKRSTAMTDSEPPSPATQYARYDMMSVLKSNRLIDSTVQTSSEMVPSERSLQHRQQVGNYLIGFAAFFAVLLLHSMIIVFSGLNSYLENEWSNIILILIFAAVAAISMKAVSRLIEGQQRHMMAAMIRLCNYYQELDFQHLLVPQGKHAPAPAPTQATTGLPTDPGSLVHLNYSVRVTHLSPRQRHILLSVYHQQAEIFRYQSNTPIWSLLSLLLLLASEALIATAVLLVFVIVLCRIPSNEFIDSCETKLGVPIGIGLFVALMLAHVGELVKLSYAFTTRWISRL